MPWDHFSPTLRMGWGHHRTLWRMQSCHCLKWTGTLRWDISGGGKAWLCFLTSWTTKVCIDVNLYSFKKITFILVYILSLVKDQWRYVQFTLRVMCNVYVIWWFTHCIYVYHSPFVFQLLIHPWNSAGQVHTGTPSKCPQCAPNYFSWYVHHCKLYETC